VGVSDRAPVLQLRGVDIEDWADRVNIRRLYASLVRERIPNPVGGADLVAHAELDVHIVRVG